MRRYHIYFEPFVDKIRVNQYIGLDMSFYSELLPVESLKEVSYDLQRIRYCSIRYQI